MNRSLFSTMLLAVSLGAAPALADAPDAGGADEELFLDGPGATNLDPDGGFSLGGSHLVIESTGLEGGGNDDCGGSGNGCQCDVGYRGPTGASLLVGAAIFVALGLRRSRP